MDDVIITPPSFNEHLDHLNQVFTLLRDAGLTLNREKCHFARDKLKYLGLVISKEGIEADNSKVKAITEMKPPKNSNEVSKFLGMAGWYQKLIPKYADICEPLYRLKKKGAKFNWSTEAHDSFDKIKRALTEPSILQLPNFTEQFNLFTDASSFGTGVVLNQNHIPISFASRTLNKAERNYTVIERELLAVIWALNKFETYYGSLPVKLIRDHAALTKCAALRALALNSREQLIREQREDPELGHIYRYLENPDDSSVNPTVGEDLLGPYPASRPKRYRFLLVITDHFTKWSELIPLRKASAQAIASALFENYISRYGAPISLISDNGPQFISDVFEHLSHRLDIKHIKTDSHVETLYEGQRSSNRSSRSQPGKFKVSRKTSIQESNGRKSNKGNAGWEDPRLKRKIESNGSRDRKDLKRSKICRKRSLQGSEHRDQKRPTLEPKQGGKSAIPSSVPSRNYKYRRPNIPSQGSQSILGPSHLRNTRQGKPPTEGSKHDMTGQYDKAREIRTTTSGTNSAAERRPVRSKQATAVRPCPYYLRSRVKQPEVVQEDRSRIGIESTPQNNIRRRSLSMEALDGDPVDRSE
ncbi:retrovirus-related Pol polyprotein from transposon 297 [Trichonephila clavipes]|nr:retrovirus-related Pol polyprotein from transposon 297 [Trichonephila clavipes]